MNKNGEVFFNKHNSIILKNKFWHLTHLRRSTRDDADYSSGGSRATKRRLTYTIIGKKINATLPETFSEKNLERLSPSKSLCNLLRLFFSKVLVGYIRNA